jgi:site-specific recombinase XerD
MRAANLRTRTADHVPVPDESSRINCSDAIERFLDRSWMVDRTPLPVVDGHRLALNELDGWLLHRRRVRLTSASASDVRALLDSTHWDALSRRFEALLGLVTRFYRDLQECKFRPDDPIEMLVRQELAAAATRIAVVQATKGAKPGRKPIPNRPRVI